MRYHESVSYTHLDVYKRQALGLYFLAACEALTSEHTSMLLTGATIVPSSQTLRQVAQAFPDIDPSRLHILGFPLDLDRLATFALEWKKKEPNSVIFLGETRPEKQPDLEVNIAKKLIDLGYTCYHSSPTKVSIRSQLEDIGVQVIEDIQGEDYLKLLARMQYVVCTSSHESLYVSGIEGTALGAQVILPNNPDAGYMDWCVRENLYNPDDVQSAVERIQATREDKNGEPLGAIQQYDRAHFFNRIIELADRLRSSPRNL